MHSKSLVESSHVRSPSIVWWLQYCLSDGVPRVSAVARVRKAAGECTGPERQAEFFACAGRQCRMSSPRRGELVEKLARLRVSVRLSSPAMRSWKRETSEPKMAGTSIGDGAEVIR